MDKEKLKNLIEKDSPDNTVVGFPMYNTKTWYEMVMKIYSLIDHEIYEAKNVNKDDLSLIFPKLIVMYEFFRLLRGEAFNFYRPPDSDQKKFYAWEDEIAKQVEELAKKLDFNDNKTKFYLDEMKKSFDLEYFKKSGKPGSES